MPCNCSGFKTDKCNCKVLATSYQPDNHTSGLTLLAHSKSQCPLQEHNKDVNRPSFMFKLIEAFYEKCAAYNLRYCPIRGYTKHDSYFWSTLKDFVILACFLLANFVVFLAIFTKTMVHMYHVVALLARWVKRSLKSNGESRAPSAMLRTALLQPDGADYIHSTLLQYEAEPSRM